MLHVSIFIHCQNNLHTVASKSSYSNFNDLLYPILGIISLVWYLTFLFINIWTKTSIYNCNWYEHELVIILSLYLLFLYVFKFVSGTVQSYTGVPVILDFKAHPMVQYTKHFFAGFMTLGIFPTALERSTANMYISEHRTIQAPFTSITRKHSL